MCVVVLCCVVLWGCRSCKRLLVGHTARVTAVAITPNGEHAAAGAENGQVLLWSIADGEPVGQLHCACTSPVYSLQASVDGALLVAGHGDGTVAVYDLGVLLRGDRPPSEQPSNKKRARQAGVGAGAGAGAGGRGHDKRVIAADSDTPKPSRSLVTVLQTKRTAVHALTFTQRNLLLVMGPYSRSSGNKL